MVDVVERTATSYLAPTLRLICRVYNYMNLLIFFCHCSLVYFYLYFETFFHSMCTMHYWHFEHFGYSAVMQYCDYRCADTIAVEMYSMCSMPLSLFFCVVCMYVFLDLCTPTPAYSLLRLAALYKSINK